MVGAFGLLLNWLKMLDELEKSEACTATDSFLYIGNRYLRLVQNPQSLVEGRAVVMQQIHLLEISRQESNIG